MAPRDTAREITILGGGQPVSVRHAQAAGITRGQIRAAISAGYLSIPQRGVVFATSLQPDDPLSQYKTRILSFVRTHPETILCSWSAGHLLELPLPIRGAPRYVHVLGPRSRRTAQVWRHNYPPCEVITDAETGLSLTHPLATASQIATHVDLPQALVELEASMRKTVLDLVHGTQRHDTPRVDYVDVRDVTARDRVRQMLAEIVGGWRHRAGAAKLIEAAAVASPLSESPAESLSHGHLVRFGYTIEQQVEVRDADGVHRRLDFLIDGCIAGEVDGLIKYEGTHGRRQLHEDKRRDAALLAIGLPTARWTPTEIRDVPHIVKNRIDTAMGRVRRTAIFHRAG